MKKERLAGILVFILVSISLSVPVFAAGDARIIAIGERIQLQSTILGEERNIFVHRPTGYNTSEARYPVLYLFDADAHFNIVASTVQNLSNNGIIPQMLVVGLTNTVRNRDFTPVSIEEMEQSGGGELFVQFLEKELFPFIERKYRTEPYRIEVGHSLCGMFTIFTLLKYPHLFNAYCAISPWLMFADEYVNTSAVEWLQRGKYSNEELYITYGHEPEYEKVITGLDLLLKNHGPDSINWKLDVMESEDHNTIVLPAVFYGLRSLFIDWKISNETIRQGLPHIEKHYAKLGARMEYDIQVPEYVLNYLGYLRLQDNKYSEAIEVFEKNAKTYPASANVYDSLGEAYEVDGQLKKAMKNYKIAIKTAKKNASPFLLTYEQHLDRVKIKMKNVPREKD